MRSTGGVKLNWPLVAIAFAVIGVPMGVALIQDLGSDRDDEELLARIGQVGDISAAPQADTGDDDGAQDTGSWRQPAMDQAFFDEVFLGGPEERKPALRGPLADIDWEAASPAPPDLSRWPRARAELLDYKGSAPGIDELTVSFPDDGTAGRVFAARWGEPRVMVGDDQQVRLAWFDRPGRLRLVLEQGEGSARATFHSFVAARDYVDASGRFAFETTPVLGATPAELAARYGRLYSEQPSPNIECPGTETSMLGATCYVTFAGGKAVELAFMTEHGLDREGGPDLFDGLREALGPVRRHWSEGDVNHWRFDHGITVIQRAGEHGLWMRKSAR